jgi:ATP-dependent protease ClpP protease subunit
MKKMATKRIEIRGVILDASFDIEWLDKYVEKGIFTPESRIRSQLKAAAEAGDDVELYISSQGGSVVAGNEIIAAFADYPHGKSITVGAFAASMAANIALQAGVPVRAHNNTLFLFHGAWGVTIGGKDAHGDSAKMLDQINEPIRAALAAKGVPADVIEAGFGEGRELTMTAAEAKEWGIVSEIIDEPAPLVARLEKSDEDDILAHGSEIPVAACAAWQTHLNAEDGEAVEDTPDADAPAEETPVEETPVAPSAELSPDVAALVDRMAHLESQRRDLQSQRDKLAAQLADEQKAWEEERAALQASVDSLTQAKTNLESRLAGMALNALGTPTGGCAQSWPEALSECGGYEGAVRKYPHLAEAYRLEKSR